MLALESPLLVDRGDKRPPQALEPLELDTDNVARLAYETLT